MGGKRILQTLLPASMVHPRSLASGRRGGHCGSAGRRAKPPTTLLWCAPNLGYNRNPFGGDNKMLKRSIKTVLVGVTLLFATTISIFAQTSQAPAAQEADAQSNNISDQ